MEPTHDDSNESEPPMTRALFATDLDESLLGPPGDPHGTVEEDTRRLPSQTDIDLSKLPAGQGPGSSGPPPGSMSAWSSTGGMGRRGIVGKIEPGQVLYNKYLVIRKLGAGAMGEVWLVRHVTLKSENALKVIIPNYVSNPVALMRFQRELEIMAQLRLEHAVTIFDASLDEDGGYIDMEYLDGQTIHEILLARKNRPEFDPTVPLMPLDWIVRVLDQLCEVLQVAHAKGIVHRDLKPSNMMLLNGRKPGKESLKVLDFGIAKIREDSEKTAAQVEEPANRTQGFIGTPSYASPEQAMSREIDGRSDLYSVGVMLYEFVTGRLPFRGNHWQVMSQHASEPAPPFAEANPRLRPLPELEHAILRVLSKEADRRPSTAAELFEEVREAVEAILPAGSPVLSPSTWSDASRISSHGPGSSTSHPTLFPTERESEFGARPISTQDPTLLAETPPVAPAKPNRESPSDLGPVVPDTFTPRRRWPIVRIAGPMLVSVGLVAAFGVWNRYPKVAIEGPGPVKGVVAPEPLTPPEDRKDFEKNWPPTYLPIGEAGADPAWPDKVRRTTDDVYFVKFADRVYLPEGYEVPDRADLAKDGWPRVIAREGIRFLRIVDRGEWTMGDWNVPAAVVQNDAPAHPVIVSGFYIQETEFTNGQFEAYLKKAPGTTGTDDWKANYVRLRQKLDDPKDGEKFPAVNISHKMARAVADYMDGQIPTEAQWEYAARSEGQRLRFAWGDSPVANRDQANVDSTTASAAPVGSYKGKDETQQHVFDMIGNVQELCRDAWLPYKKSLLAERDPCPMPGPDDDTPEFAIRGGSFDKFGQDCASTRRDEHRPIGERAENIGFRLVVECPNPRKPR